ncbi:MAG: toxin secretion, membrane fusion protein [Candidatus Riflebacteria bacterium]|nr:toxin secretion, membrane fusion protein [Candidatus Riflebacteria bacterium]
MEKIIKNTTHEKQALEDRLFWRNQTPDERLDMVEKLRLEAGKFLYEYPARFQRVISVTRRT